MKTNIFTSIKAFIVAHKIVVIGTVAAIVVAGCAGVAVAVARGNNDAPPAKDDVTTVNTETNETADTTVLDTSEGTTYEPEVTETSSEIISETVVDEPETDETDDTDDTDETDETDETEGLTLPKTNGEPEETTAEQTEAPEVTTETEAVETPKETTAAPMTEDTTVENNWIGAPEVIPDTNTPVVENTDPVVSSEPDTSLLTWSEADVGKVVGYDALLQQDIVVVSVRERVNGSGLKGITITYSNGSTDSLVECGYCHKTPCPNGGGENCAEYSVEKDGTKTCERCGKTKGDGYNGTCLGTIDWANGGELSCTHYN